MYSFCFFLLCLHSRSLVEECVNVVVHSASAAAAADDVDDDDVDDDDDDDDGCDNMASATHGPTVSRSQVSE